MKSYFDRLSGRISNTIVAVSVSLCGFTGVSEAQTQVVVDDDDTTGVTYTGTWTRTTTNPTEIYGASARSDGASGRGTKQVRFTPNLPVAGVYKVEAWWREDSSRSNQVPVIVNSSEGTYSTTVNQRHHGSAWNVVTQRQFAAGINSSTGSLIINNTGTTDGAVTADAVRWTLVTGTEVIVDNDDAGFSSTFGRESDEDGIYGPSFHTNYGTYPGLKDATFTPTFPVAGLYSIFGWWNAQADRASNIPFDLVSNQGTTTVYQNQRLNGSQWKLLGSAQFLAGNNASIGSVKIRTEGTAGTSTPVAERGIVVADAIRWLLVTAAPTAPTGLNATGGNSQVTVTWSAVSGATGYKLYRSTTNGATGSATPVTVSGTSYTDTGLTNGTAYYYTLRATNAGGDSPASTQVNATPIAPPSAPMGVTATAGNAQVSLSWTASTGSGTITYDVTRSTSSGGTYTSVASGLSGLTNTNTGLTNNTTYYYKIVANNAGGSTASAVVSATPIAPPSTPTGVTATAGNAQVTLAWSASTGSGTIKYDVLRSTSSGGTYTAAASDLTALTYPNTGLTNGTTYYYKIVASNAGGSATSTAVAGTPLAVPIIDDKIPGNTVAQLSWNTLVGATAYRVYRSTTSGQLGTLVSSPSTTSYTNTGLTNGTTYYFTVCGYATNGGEGPASTQVSVTPVARPVLSIASLASGSVSLSWTSASTAGVTTTYNVLRSSTSGGTTTTVATGLTGLTYTNSGLTNGTTYYYKVQAANPDPNTSLISDEQDATPMAAPVATATAGNTVVTLSWPAVSGATGYQVYESTASGTLGTLVSAPSASPYTRTGRTNNTTYYYTLKAINSSGVGPASTQVSATPIAPPSTPTGVTATAGNAQVTLAWSASTGSGTIRYEVLRSTSSGGTYTSVVDNLSTLTYVNTGLTNDTTYYYKIVASNASGDSAASSVASATPIASPAAPTGVTATPGNSSVVLSWNASTGSGTIKYDVLRSTSSGGTYTAVTSDLSVLTYTNSGLTNGTTYYYKIVASNASGDSAPSSIVSATPIAPPSAPTGVTATAGNAQISLTWSASTGGGSIKYDVLRSTSSGGTYTDVATDLTTLTYVNTGLTNGTTYYYKIVANNAGGSATSSVVSATPIAPPSAASTLTLESTGDSSANLSWTTVSGATSYRIKRGTADGGPYTTLSNVVTGTTFADTGLTNGTTYYYRVFGVNGSGNGPDSNQASGIPLALPTAVGTVTLTAGDAQIDISFAAVANASEYRVYRSTTSNTYNYSTPVKTLTGTGTITATDTGLTNGTAYYYVVRSVNTTGSSASSTQVSAIPLAKPTAPTLSGSAGNASATLTWNTISGATSYSVKRSTTSGSGYSVLPSGPFTSPYVDSTVINGVTYYYVVSASNASGEGNNSNQVQLSPAAPTPTPVPTVTPTPLPTATPTPTPTPIAPPSAPTGVTAIAGNAQVSLSWSASTGSGTITYEVLRSTSAGGTYISVVGGLSTLSYVNNTGLTNNTTYYYKVVANNAGGSTTSAVVSATPIAPPSTPTGVTATAGNAQVTLAWSASTGGGTIKYDVLRSTSSGGTYTSVASDLAALTYTNTGLTNGTTYYYKIVASNAGGDSAASSVVSATPVAAPAAPTGVTATAGNASVVLAWSASTGGGTIKYEVVRSTSSGGTYTSVVDDLTALTYTNTGLTNGTTYFYKIIASNAGGSATSSVVSATPLDVPVVNAVAGAAQVTLTWNSITGADSYRVYQSTTLGQLGSEIGSPTATTLLVTPLTNGTTYYFTVRAYSNNGGNGPLSTQVDATPVALPATPTGLSASAGNEQITLEWNAVSGATGYKLYRSTTNGVTGTATPVSVSGTTHVDTDVTNGTTYYYTLKATNTSGDSAASSQVSATPIAPPSAASTLTLESTGDSSANLSWTTVSGATSYRIKRGTADGGPYTTLSNVVTGTTFADTGLTNGTTYYYRVFGVNGSGNGPDSNQASGIPLALPTAVGTVTLTAGDAQIDISFAAVANASEYRVYRSTTSNTYNYSTPVKTLTGTGTITATDTGLTNGTAYYYVVRSVNTTGSSASSTQVSATPVAVPSGLYAVAGNAQVSLSWDAVAGATGYKLYRGTTEGETGTETPINVSGTSYTHTGLTNGTTYYYTLKAVNTSGESPASAEVSATPVSAPLAVTGLSATAGNGQVTLAWSAASGAGTIKYEVVRSTSSTGTYTSVTTGLSGLTYTNTGLTNGTTYYYKIVASNAGGSATSGFVACTPIAAPTLTAAAGSSQVSLSWTTVFGSTGYEVYQSPTAGQLGSLINSPTAAELLVTNLTNGTTYYFTVRANGETGFGPFSEQVAVTPISAPVLSITTLGNGSVSLSWTAIEGANHYEIYRSLSTSAFTSTPLAARTTASYTDTTVTNGVSYQYKIRAANPNPDSSLTSNVVIATPLEAPAVTTVAGDSQVFLSWTQVSGATSYRVYQSTVAGQLGTLVYSPTTTSQTVTGLTNGTTYYFTVRGVNASGDGPLSTQVNETPTATPIPVPVDAPVLTAVPSPTQVFLGWTQVSGATSYRVYQSTVAGQLGTLVYSPTTTSQTVTGLTNGTTYYFTVRGVNASGDGPLSTQVSAKPEALPETVDPVTATAGDGQNTLSFQSVAGATEYRVFYSLISGEYDFNTTNFTVTGTGTLSLVDDTVTNGYLYYYVVRAANGSGMSPPSTEVSARPLATPDAPVLSGTAGNGETELNWTNADGATTYTLKRSTTNGGPYTTVTTGGPTLISHTDTTVTNETTYYYIVTASNANGVNTNSNQISLKPSETPDDEEPPGEEPDFGTPRPLLEILDNREGMPWSAVRLVASQQATITLGPKHRNIPETIPFYAAFEGTFTPAANDTRLAIFSDDGCNVYIDGELVHNKMGVGQHLPALDQSLHQIDKELGAGQVYDIRVEYFNGWFTGVTDADGATLFAYTHDDNEDRPLVEWRSGTPISCGGIRWPLITGSTISPSTPSKVSEGQLSAFLATDYDQRDATIEGVLSTGVYSDPCSYTWTVSGGSFKNGINKGQGVVWIVPQTPGTYTITLTVDDQNMANQPTYESGARNDLARGYNDPSLKFTSTVTVSP